MAFRDFFHNCIDTTNISESLFNSLKAELKYAINRKIRVVFEVLFKKFKSLAQKVKITR